MKVWSVLVGALGGVAVAVTGYVLYKEKKGKELCREIVMEAKLRELNAKLNKSKKDRETALRVQEELERDSSTEALPADEWDYDDYPDTDDDADYNLYSLNDTDLGSEEDAFPDQSD